MKLNKFADWYDYEYESLLSLRHRASSDKPSYTKSDYDKWMSDKSIEPVDWRMN